MSEHELNPVEPMQAEGVAEFAAGTEKVVAAKALGDLSRDFESAGVSNLTRAVDAKIAAERMAALSQVVNAAGAQDVAEGAELPADIVVPTPAPAK